jgi:hypothetical protein
MKVLTANRLSDGAVVYLANHGGWTRDFADAARLDPDAAAGALAQAQAQPRVLVGAYLVELDGEAVERRERLREAIRAKGPSVGHSLKQGAA